LFVRVNFAVTEVSPTARALPKDIERLKLWPKLDLGRTTADVAETAGVAEVHPTAAIMTSTRPPNHFRDFPLPNGRRVRSTRVLGGLFRGLVMPKPIRFEYLPRSERPVATHINPC
jgi:hypothetical protein